MLGLCQSGVFRGKRVRVWSMAVKDMGVEQIERAITRLPAKDLAMLMSWLEDYHEQVWDKRIEEDLKAGRLDALLAEADEEYNAGLSQPL